MVADRSSSMEQQVFTDLSGAICSFQWPLVQQIYKTSSFTLLFFVLLFRAGRVHRGKVMEQKKNRKFQRRGRVLRTNLVMIKMAATREKM